MTTNMLGGSGACSPGTLNPNKSCCLFSYRIHQRVAQVYNPGTWQAGLSQVLGSPGLQSETWSQEMARETNNSLQKS